MRNAYLAGILAAGLLLEAGLVSAAPVTVINPFYFRENRGANDTGQGTGDRLIYGAGSVVPNGDAGTTATRQFGAGQLGNLPFNPRTVNPNQFSGSADYLLARANAQIHLVFTNGADTTTANVNPIGAIGLMPLATNLGMSGTGTNLIFNWTDPVIPLGLTLERAQFVVYDLENINSNGNADDIYQVFLQSPTDTTYALPGSFSSTLQLGHHYAFGIRLEDLREGVDPTLAGAARQSSSQAYFNFTPVPEPGTYAMMLAGLGVLGFAARRRKQGAAS